MEHHAQSDMQNEVDGKLQLWVATAYPVWQEVDVKAPDAMEQAKACVSACVDVLMERSQAHGFPADLLASGHILSMPFCCSLATSEMEVLGPTLLCGLLPGLGWFGCPEMGVMALQGDALT